MATILLVTSATDSWESSLEGGAGHGHGHGHISSPDLWIWSDYDLCYDCYAVVQYVLS